MNFAEGTLWSEPGAGTNAIGTAIAADHAVQVFGPEHFNEPVQRWTCSRGADPRPRHRRAARRDRPHRATSRTVHPHSLAVATATAQAVEAGAARSSCRSATRACAPATAAASPSRRAARAGHAVRPRRSPPSRAGWGRHGPAGDPARRRRAGAALRRARGRRAGRPGARGVRRARGRSAARAPAQPGRWCKLQLPRPRPRAARDRRPPHRAAPAAGRDPRAAVRAPRRDERRARCAPTCTATAAAPRSVRVEVSRLRKLLGPWIDTDRYRLTCDVETDVRRVEGLLARRRGARGGRGLPRPAAAELRGARRRRASASTSTPGCARP